MGILEEIASFPRCECWMLDRESCGSGSLGFRALSLPLSRGLALLACCLLGRAAVVLELPAAGRGRVLEAAPGKLGTAGEISEHL